MAKVFFVSDAHISSTKDMAYKRFLSFIEYVKKESATDLFILGDLFEFLHGHGGYVIKKYQKLFDGLKALSLAGTKIYYLYGNHDFDFKLPFDFIRSSASFNNIEVDGINCMVFHGDGLDPHDTKYRFLKSIIRGSFFKFIVKFIPDFILYRIAGLFSAISKNSGSSKMVNENRFLYYRDYALKKLSYTDLNIVVFGHTHVPDLSRINLKNGKFKYYINTGHFGRNGTYGILDNDFVYIGVFNNKMLLSE
ncbi:MAG: UDP-2,3-diacylglucosamine diphosphatase [Proteobacteria bacterium]|nr:UDP-2,3-diacylglucosamine diphosphatase [Pseudomonadota bacterium]